MQFNRFFPGAPGLRMTMWRLRMTIRPHTYSIKGFHYRLFNSHNSFLFFLTVSFFGFFNVGIVALHVVLFATRTNYLDNGAGSVAFDYACGLRGGIGLWGVRPGGKRGPDRGNSSFRSQADRPTHLYLVAF